MGNWVSLSSSMISAVKYEADKLELYVRFNSNGATYIYEGVPADEADDFITSASPGSYFHNNIKDSYGSRRG